ncbi:MAG: outer membrane protein assembly factor BamE [Zoogloeaceae bacterium]|jgi:outer membrane protein assembly factor BamE|nr:outer membrane protein assembly factor BamE [Zoogloeaceae bacterium]
MIPTLLYLSNFSCRFFFMVRRLIVLTFGFVWLSMLAACSTVPRFIERYEYKADIQQGNVLTQEMVAQLRPDLSRDQVRFILGSPLLTDLFHANRWDYLFSLKEGKTGEVALRHLSVFFDAEGRLTRVAGNVEARREQAPTVPMARTRVIDLGTIPPDTPPLEEEKSGFLRQFWTP